MTTVSDLVTDLDDSDVDILKRLTASLARPSRPDEEDRWPSRVQGFWHNLCADLDEELCRRQRMVSVLDALADEDGTGALVSDDEPDEAA
jgi:hypothetical protein